MTPLVSVKTRQAFREYMVGWILRQIGDEFDAAGIECDKAFIPSTGGERRSLVEQYYKTIDWSSWNGVKPVLQVFETVLHEAEVAAAQPDPHYQKDRQKSYNNLLWLLKRDGFEWRNGRIVSSSGIPSLQGIKATADVFDVHYLSEQLRRMEAAVESDPALAIGTAKEVIETCCRTILGDRGKPVRGTPDIPSLTKETLKELSLVPEGVPEASRGSDIIKRTLHNLGSIANGLAELRGLYGTGHGKDGKAKGLGPRHAKLAVGAAVTLVTFLFDTHREGKK